jgi:hypothetical protein
MPSRTPPFRPRFMLTLLYLAGFFVLYALLLVAPELLPLLGSEGRSLPPEELRERARQVSQQAMQGKVLIALAAALVTVGVGAWRRALPGMR